MTSHVIEIRTQISKKKKEKELYLLFGDDIYNERHMINSGTKLCDRNRLLQIGPCKTKYGGHKKRLSEFY